MTKIKHPKATQVHYGMTRLGWMIEGRVGIWKWKRRGDRAQREETVATTPHLARTRPIPITARGFFSASAFRQQPSIFVRHKEMESFLRNLLRGKFGRNK